MIAKMPVQINRDPFARASLMRVTYDDGQTHKCKFCGQPAKFAYAWESDGRAGADYNGPFCGVGCYRIYTEQEPGFPRR